MQECTLDLDQAPLTAAVPLSPGAAHAPWLIRAGISLKRAGDMGRVTANPRLFPPARTALLQAAGLADYKVFACRQVHSQTVLKVGDSSPEELGLREADGLLTDRPDALLTVTVADCLPIFLADPLRGVIGLLHSGWRGTGIVERAVELMRSDYGCPPEALAVTIGPGIGSCCYRVEEQRADTFRRLFGEAAVRRRNEDPYLDLRAANLHLLDRLGVRNVTVVRDCTACTPQLASYRRDGASFVRMLAFIGAAGAWRSRS
jgi:YfiH family protein